MSRSREASRVYVVADDTAVAAEDLVRDWKRERRPTWAIDTGLPDTGYLTVETVGAMTPDERPEPWPSLTPRRPDPATPGGRP